MARATHVRIRTTDTRLRVPQERHTHTCRCRINACSATPSLAQLSGLAWASRLHCLVLSCLTRSLHGSKSVSCPVLSSRSSTAVWNWKRGHPCPRGLEPPTPDYVPDGTAVAPNMVISRKPPATLEKTKSLSQELAGAPDRGACQPHSSTCIATSPHQKGCHVCAAVHLALTCFTSYSTWLHYLIFMYLCPPPFAHSKSILGATRPTRTPCLPVSPYPEAVCPFRSQVIMIIMHRQHPKEHPPYSHALLTPLAFYTAPPASYSDRSRMSTTARMQSPCFIVSKALFICGSVLRCVMNSSTLRAPLR